MKATFLGVGTWLPEYPESDTASLLVDEHILIDCGWHVTHNLLCADVRPDKVDTILFTHMHQDHYISLAQLLFYRMNSFHTFDGIVIYGPEGLDEIIERVLLFIRSDKHYSGSDHHKQPMGVPEYHVLHGGDSFALGDVKVSCAETHHAVPSVAYRLEEAGKTLVYSGDTAACAEVRELAKGCDVLIHESAFGATPTTGRNAYSHSGAMDAASCAVSCGAKKLYLVHTDEKGREAAVAAAKAVFANVSYPKEGDTILL